ncbi:MAG: response regulator, partial [Deltaproteobacteria bacterium]
MKQDLGRVWFLVEVPRSEIDTVLEFQSFNLIELEAYSIDDRQNILPLQSLKHPLEHHHGFLVPGHLKKQKLLLMTDQEIGGFFLGFQHYSTEQFEQIKLYRSLMVGLVIGLFLLSLLMTLLVRGNPNQPWLLAIIISGVIGLFLEKRIYTFLNFEIDSMTYMKTFMFQLSISTIAYLRIISFETNLIKKRPYFLIERSLEIIITILFISGMILSLRMDGISLIQDTSIPFQLIVIGFIVSYLFCCFLLIQSWNKKPHLNEFSIAFILVYSLVIFTNFSVRGILPEDFNLWDGNYRAVIPLILALILYKDREVKMRNMANLLSLQDKNKDLFLARTSHELRTPLSGMIGLCENMLEKAEGLTPSFIRKLKLVVQNGWRMNQLISDLTDFSKMREGQLKVECRPEDFGEILDRVKENLKPEMERKQLTWKININPELPMIHADSDRIQQVLMNLIGNAIKYTEHGSILLEASASKSFVEVNIQDNGMGIPEEELRLVLEDYQRGTNVATTPGTGLGLNLSRHIIELHGGELSIESEVGKGTKVGFTLPVSEHNTSQIPSPTTTTPLSEEDLQETPGQIETDLPIPEKAKVLVVDDEPVNLEIIEDFLEELPLEITCYSSGDEFLNHLDEDEPDLLILDLMMPNMDGYAVIRQIRSEYSAQELPILVVTANEQERFSHQSLSLGANDYLIKPLEGRELRMRVRSQLSLTRQHRLQESVELLEKQKLALKRDQGRMKNLLDGVDLSLAVTDSKGKILQINRAFERLSGYAPD